MNGLFLVLVLGWLVYMATSDASVKRRLLYSLWCGPLMAGLVGLVYVGVGMCLTAVVLSNSHPQRFIQDRVVALHGGTGVSGSITGTFLFVSGSIGSSVLYTYYVQEGDGAYRAKQLSSKNDQRDVDIVVFEEDRQDAELDSLWSIREYPEWWTQWFPKITDTFQRYEFRVPRGSILREFRP